MKAGKRQALFQDDMPKAPESSEWPGEGSYGNLGKIHAFILQLCMKGLLRALCEAHVYEGENRKAGEIAKGLCPSRRGPDIAPEPWGASGGLPGAT